MQHTHLTHLKEAQLKAHHNLFFFFFFLPKQNTIQTGSQATQAKATKGGACSRRRALAVIEFHANNSSDMSYERRDSDSRAQTVVFR